MACNYNNPHSKLNRSIYTFMYSIKLHTNEDGDYKNSHHLKVYVDTLNYHIN